MENIRLGNSYATKYLISGQYIFAESVVNDKDTFTKIYIIKNRPNSPIFRGVLYILHDGRALMFVEYTSYSGVKNKYTNYFDCQGREIIHKSNNSKLEKQYFNNLQL